MPHHPSPGKVGEGRTHHRVNFDFFIFTFELEAGADIKAFEPMIQDLVTQSPICVYGNADKLKESADLFEELITLD